ncbi:potassium-transporting ATPase subunit C [Streptomyces sp. TS71-3]|uniref:potassium-transporting ATPase subunit C n=1 Tax=Streptomyces sp. TS71-3 TaxID=2733862 RepID=UPI001AFE423E|nr:potassium-transporting ATPase subunit C [Streptomyces sp. TS71-3]GHJ38580.1 potassium-transporting ATPase KdpC subunit [Streptomyces sp. TS71-3]
MLWGNLWRGLVVSLIFFVLLGLAYPLAGSGIGQALFHDKAGGSLGEHGSVLVGQQWNGTKWFQGRPDGDDPTATGGSNLGPRSQELVKTYQKRVAALEKQGIKPTADLVTASGSGIDPNVSPAGPYAQVDAVAKARHLPADRVHDLVADHVEGPQWGFLGAEHVNVLKLNEALAELD